MKFYVKFEDETLEQCIKAHCYSNGYDSVEHAIIDTNLMEQNGTKFDVVNENGVIKKSCIAGQDE